MDVEGVATLIMRLLVIGSAIGVAVDASRLGARRGRLGGGFLDMGPAAWFFATLLFWLIALPCYLVVRPRLVAANRYPVPPTGQPYHPQAFPPAQLVMPPVAGPQPSGPPSPGTMPPHGQSPYPTAAPVGPPQFGSQPYGNGVPAQPGAPRAAQYGGQHPPIQPATPATPPFAAPSSGRYPGVMPGPAPSYGAGTGAAVSQAPKEHRLPPLPRHQ